ncbi:MAG: ABC transporter permease protein [candidate division WWE3 bacterium GW2011_GWE2_42_25]|nr:MAG: ABC transporter permease protein [candidate division WWE3 bacterium GW2011_GWE2_42_25]
MIILEQLKRSWAITKKNLTVSFLRGPVIVFGIVMPAFLFVSFSLKRQISIESLIPGLLGMSLFFTVSSITPGIMPWETKMKTLERIISSPVKLWAIILGDVLSSFIYGILITIPIFFVSSLFLGKLIINIPIFLATILAAFCFSSLGELISSIPTDNPSNAMMLSTLIKFPLIFISGIFIPLTEMGSLRIVSFFSPPNLLHRFIKRVHRK